MMLFIVIGLENIIEFSSSICEKPNIVYGRPKPSQKNFKTYRKITIANLLTKQCHVACGNFLTTLVFVGISTGTFGAYIGIKLFHQINFITYLAGPAIAVQSLLSSFSFSYFGGMLYNNCDNFKKYWLLYAKKREGKKCYKHAVTLVVLRWVHMVYVRLN